MPTKRKMKRRPRYRRYRRRNNFPLRNAPVPPTKIVKLKYAECFNLDAVGASGAAAYVFRANSIFDANLTSTGHQPYATDQWANFYKKYRVLGSKLTLQAVSNSTSVNGQHIVSVLTSYDSASSLTYNTSVLERPGTVWATLGTLGATNGTKRLVKYWSAKKSFGKGWKDDDCAATFSANPVREWYYLIHTQSPDSGADPVTISCVVTIEYICQLTDPLELAQS